ncbi:MAG: 5-(carboxyamino)imidazole ribonucleotide synthase, partial [Chloroflexota bacterium]|nr:5-(carboxyamino)imidazole ribonucleotide synthase [Chloroflexota bacterium]
LDAVTYEFENVPVEAARTLAAHVPVFPPPEALEVAQDRLTEKTSFQQLSIPTPLFAAVQSREDLAAAARELGLPAVLKTRRMGYDGKGQVVLREPADVDRAWSALGGTPLILESFVPFDRELSVLGVRGRTGETAFYPLIQNTHRGGILRRSLVPAPRLTEELQSLAEGYGRRVMEDLEYVGVLAIELFQGGDQLVANEMAPRVHNSGHWTLEGAETSQFENHLRAILDLPLGSTAPRGRSAMLNIIGTLPDAQRVLAVPGAHLHLYDKAPRAGRKLGHVTVCAQDTSAAEEALTRLLA